MAGAATVGPGAPGTADAANRGGEGLPRLGSSKRKTLRGHKGDGGGPPGHHQRAVSRQRRGVRRGRNRQYGSWGLQRRARVFPGGRPGLVVARAGLLPRGRTIGPRERVGLLVEALLPQSVLNPHNGQIQSVQVRQDGLHVSLVLLRQLLQVLDAIINLQDEHWPDTLDQLQDASEELVPADPPGAVGIDALQHVLQVGLPQVDVELVEKVLDLLHAADDLLLLNLAVVVLLEAVEELRAARHQNLPMGLPFLSGLFLSELVFREHALADHAREQCDHAEGAEDYEDDKEGCQGQIILEHRCVRLDVGLRNELEEREHGLDDVAELMAQELGVGVVVGQLAHGPHQDDGPSVEHERHQNRHPEHSLGGQREAEGEHVELLQETHDSEYPYNPKEADDPEDRREASAAAT
mmetsp:Transcript_5421/g.20524  ORF Transcript_5421/g.20524 Transcript_5421/m.20524 type:complete len:409 (-) Transcript_5421:975-2201(-)